MMLMFEFKCHFVHMANHIRPGSRPFIHVLSSLSPTCNYSVFYLHVSHLTGPAKAQLFRGHDDSLAGVDAAQTGAVVDDVTIITSDITTSADATTDG